MAGSHSVVVQVERDGPIGGAVDLFSDGMKDVKQIAGNAQDDRASSAAAGARRDPRLGTVEIEWLDSTDEAAAHSGGDDATGTPSQMSFTSGRTQVASGIVHVFRRAAAIGAKGLDAIATDTVCVLAVPTWMSTADFLHFAGPLSDTFTHVRIVRDGMPNRFLVLIKLASVAAAITFHKAYNQRPFSSMEPACCQVVFVSRVEFLSAGEMNSFPADESGLLELPTCPVCLERMDSSLSGVFTLLCNHTFHCKCLAKWGDSSCPVCRYSSQNDHDSPSECSDCSATADLWMCLICGNVGCGRYGGGHASEHFRTTHHPFAIDLETQRVWDYVGDEYVHRLIANKADGKVVELPGPDDGDSSSQVVSKDKMDRIAIDFGNLLTTQLESQRLYFQEEIAKLEAQAHETAHANVAEVKRLTAQNEQLLVDVRSLAERLDVSERERRAHERKVAQLSTKYAAALKDLAEEQAVASALSNNQTALREQLAERDRRIADLEDQVRDLMFFLETQRRIGESGDKDEIQGGQVIVPTTPSASPASSAKRGSPARRKR